MKKKTIKFLLAILFIIIMQFMCSNRIYASDSYYKESDTKEQYNNYSSNNYNGKSSPVDTNLIVNNDGTFSKVQVMWNQSKYISKVSIEKYSSNFEYISSKEVPEELNICGGYYCGEKYNFLVFGQVNKEEEDSKEVIRVVKYDKNWNRISHCSLKAINTYIPFDAGSCRMVEKNGILYINTCHEMYKSSDGLNHQSNMFIQIDEETMNCLFVRSGVSNLGTGYVSHSFNQFIVADASYVYTVDHGDAYPRAIALVKTQLGKAYPTQTAIVYPISGKGGNNSTGVSIGGVELSESSCIIAGNSVKQNPNVQEESNYQEKRNIFLTITDKNNISKENTTIKWITNYAADGDVYCNTPHLVKINENKFVLLWEEISSTEVNVRAVIIDKNGKFISNMISIGGRLSSCKPILYNNKIIWCVTNGEKVIFFNLNVADINTFNNYNNQYKVDKNDFLHFNYTFNPQNGIYVLSDFDNKISNVTLPKNKYPWTNYELAISTFYQSDAIQNVTIPEGYTIIPNCCFESASNLKKITLPSTLKQIGQQAFAFTALESIVVPDNVSVIGRAAFFGIKELRNLVLPKKLIVIEELLCASNSSLNQITIPDSVTEIKRGAFESTALTSIVIPSSVKTIGEEAFSFCDCLSGTVTIPASVTNIGNEAFYYDNIIEKIEVKNIYAKLGFNILTNNKKLVIGESYKPTIGVNFSNVKTDNENVKIGKDGTITAVAEGRATVDYCDSNGNKIVTTSITIYNKKIPLTQLSLNKNVCYMKKDEKDKLSVTYTPNPTTDSTEVNWSSSNENVVLVDTYGNIRAIGNGTATITCRSKNNSNIKITCKVTVANSFEDKYEYKILDNNNIQITKYLGTSSDVTIPNSIDGYTVTQLGGYIFGDYNKANNTLKKVTIPNTVTKIDSAFSYCNVLEQLTIPQGVTQIGQGFANNNPKLKEIKVDSNNSNYMSVDGVLYKKSDNQPTSLIYYPQGKTSATFTVPSSVSSIEAWSFYGNNYIQEIQCLKNVSYIQYNSLKNMTNLKKLYILNSAISMSNFYGLKTIEDCPNLTIYGLDSSTAQTYANQNNIKFQVVNNKITSLKLEKTTYKFTALNQGEYINIIIEPKLATNTTLTYTSANTGIAKVTSSGYIYPIGNGTTTVTIKTNDGSNKTVSVTVNVDIKCTSVIVNNKNIEISGNYNSYVSAYAYPYAASNKNLKYSSKNTEIAKVDQNGKITPIKNGTTEIYVETTDGSNIKETVIVKVTGQAQSAGLPFTDVKSSDWYYTDLKYCYDKGIIIGTDKNTFDYNAKFTKGMLVTILWRMEGKPAAKFTTKFVDCPKGYWCYDAAQWSIASGVAYKLDDTHFNPEKVLERNQFIECLRNYARIKGINTSARADLTKFKDYNRQPEYSKAAMSWAVAKKIMLGGDNGTMLYPLNTATKAEAVSFIARYCRQIGL